MYTFIFDVFWEKQPKQNFDFLFIPSFLNFVLLILVLSVVLILTLMHLYFIFTIKIKKGTVKKHPASSIKYYISFSVLSLYIFIFQINLEYKANFHLRQFRWHQDYLKNWSINKWLTFWNVWRSVVKHEDLLVRYIYFWKVTGVIVNFVTAFEANYTKAKSLGPSGW